MKYVLILSRGSTYQIGVGTTIASYTAYTRHATKVTVPTTDAKYPHGVAGHKVSDMCPKCTSIQRILSHLHGTLNFKKQIIKSTWPLEIKRGKVSPKGIRHNLFKCLFCLL